MSSDDAAGWQDHLPLDDVPESADPWDEPTDPFADPESANLFSAEIENVNASDWDLDSALIWGDDTGGAAGDDGGDILGLDLPF